LQFIAKTIVIVIVIVIVVVVVVVVVVVIVVVLVDKVKKVVSEGKVAGLALLGT